MTSFKLTVSDTKGKSLTKELKDAEATPLLGLEVGAEADATIVGFEGKIKITGGSDKSGVPMRQDVHGGARKYVLLSPGVGLNKAETGTRKRKLVRGNYKLQSFSYRIFMHQVRHTSMLQNPHVLQICSPFAF